MKVDPAHNRSSAAPPWAESPEGATEERWHTLSVEDAARKLQTNLALG